MGPGDCRSPRLASSPCGSFTPPTGISAGRSTVRGCSLPRRRSSTTCSKSSLPSGWTWWSSPVTSMTGRSPRWMRSGSRMTPSLGWRRPGHASSSPAATTTAPSASGSGPGSWTLPASTSAPTPRRSTDRCCSRTTTGRWPSTASPISTPRCCVSPGSCRARSHEAALGEAMRRVRADLATRSPDIRSVVLAHAFVAGCAPSDSERDISVGGVSMVSSSIFDGVDYTALGHLHGPHTLSDGVRYSGSPWPTPSPRPASARDRGWSTSTPPAASPPNSSRPRFRVRWRCCAATSTGCSPTPTSPGTSGRGSMPTSPTICGRCGPWSGCASGFRTPSHSASNRP